MKECLSCEKKQIAACYYYLVNEFIKNNCTDYREDDDLFTELNYRYTRSILLYDWSCGEVHSFVLKGLFLGLKTFIRKKKNFLRKHEIVPLAKISNSVCKKLNESQIWPDMISELLNVAQLSIQERRIVNLYYKKGLSKRKLSKREGISIYEVDQHLKISSEKIRFLVEKQDMGYIDFLKKEV